MTPEPWWLDAPSNDVDEHDEAAALAAEDRADRARTAARERLEDR